MSVCLVFRRTEAIDSEQALLRGEIDKLCTAAGFVYGGVLASALWSIIGLLAWRVIA